MGSTRDAETYRNLVPALCIALGAAALGASPRLRAEEPASRTVRSVVFEGRQWVPEATLRDLAGVEPGSEWSEAAGQEAVRRLASVPWLASVSPPRVAETAEGVEVVFTVRERVLVGEVEFQGNDVFDDPKLLEASGLRTGGPFLDETLREAEMRVLALYHFDGFLLASADAAVVRQEAGKADISFTVVEGKRVPLEEVRIRGAKQVSGEEARSAMGLEPRRLLGLLSKGIYAPELAEEHLDRLRAFYWSRGYLEAEVGFGGLDLALSGRYARVSIDVIEGPLYTLAEARIEGAKLFPARILERELGLPAGIPYQGAAIRDAYIRLLRWYEEHSDILPRIDVERQFDPGARAVVVFRVDESRRHVENGLVTIEGNRITRDRVIRRDVALVPGKHFTAEEVRRTRESLMASGYYDSVEIDDARGSDPERPGIEVRDITITVDEKERMRLFSFGGGVSSGPGGFGLFQVHMPNFDLFRLPAAWNDWRGAFQGGGQVLDIEVVPGARESFYDLRFLEPYFFRSDLALSLDVDTSVLDRDEYIESHVRGSPSLRHFLDGARHASIALSWVADFARIRDLDPDAPPDAIAAEGRTFLSYPRIELRWDARDANYYSGETGLFAKVQADAAGGATGSEVDFARVEATAAYAIGLWDHRPDHRHVLHAGATVGWLAGMGGDDIPLFERWYLGGPSSFRGFRYRDLGPHQGKTPVGGEGLIHGTVRYSFPMVFRELRAFALFDWGDLEGDFSSLSTGRFRTAAGGGLSVRLKLLGRPLPANLYWVKALSSEAGDREEVFQFSVGIRF